MAQPHAFRFSWRPRVPARLVPPFLRPRPDGEAPFCLTQRRIYILPSGQGLLYALLLIAMLLTAINYSLALGLVSFVVVSLVSRPEVNAAKLA